MSKLKPWPKCSVTMRDGTIQRSEVAHVGKTHTTVRFASPEKEFPGTFGPEKVNYSYRDMPNEYVTIDPE